MLQVVNTDSSRSTQSSRLAAAANLLSLSVRNTAKYLHSAAVQSEAASVCPRCLMGVCRHPRSWTTCLGCKPSSSSPLQSGRCTQGRTWQAQKRACKGPFASCFSWSNMTHQVQGGCCRSSAARCPWQHSQAPSPFRRQPAAERWYVGVPADVWRPQSLLPEPRANNKLNLVVSKISGQRPVLSASWNVLLPGTACSRPCPVKPYMCCQLCFEHLPLQQAHVPLVRHQRAAAIQGCQAVLTEVPRGLRARALGSRPGHGRNWHARHSYRWACM